MPRLIDRYISSDAYGLSTLKTHFQHAFGNRLNEIQKERDSQKPKHSPTETLLENMMIQQIAKEGISPEIVLEWNQDAFLPTLVNGLLYSAKTLQQDAEFIHAKDDLKGLRKTDQTLEKIADLLQVIFSNRGEEIMEDLQVKEADIWVAMGIKAISNPDGYFEFQDLDS